MSDMPESLRIVVWGTYDEGKPRVRIMLRGLAESDSEVIRCHRDVWQGIEDKTGVVSWTQRIRLILCWLWGYPALVIRYLKLPEHDVVIIGYLGHLDVLVLWPFAKWRGVPIVWDAFLSLYNTIVEDRRLVGRWHPLALVLYAWEWLACRAAGLVVLDSQAHADYFEKRFRLKQGHTAEVLVGAETDLFYPRPPNRERNDIDKRTVSILFYGQFIPLHGIETIIEAATRLEEEEFEWQVVGQGQEAEWMRTLLDHHPLPRLHWTPWVAFEDLPDWIQRADVCLGIFGDTIKANLVIPNKAFQILAMGKPLITRDSAAIRELVDPAPMGLILVPPADPDALVAALREFRGQAARLGGEPLYRDLLPKIQPAAIGANLVALARDASAANRSR